MPGAPMSAATAVVAAAAATLATRRPSRAGTAAAQQNPGATQHPATWLGPLSARAVLGSATPGTLTPTETAAVLLGRSSTFDQRNQLL